MAKQKRESMMNKKKQSLSRRMLFLFLFTIILPVSLMGFVFYQYLTESLQKEIILYSERSMKEKNEYYQLLMDNMNQMALNAMQRSEVQASFQELKEAVELSEISSQDTTEQAFEVFSQLIQQEGIKKIQLLLLDGKGLEFSDTIHPFYAQQPMIWQLRNESAISPQLLRWFWNNDNLSSKNEKLIAWLPFFENSQTQTSGFLLLYMDMSFLHSRLRGDMQYEQYYAVVNEDLLFLYHPHENRIGTHLKSAYLDNIRQKAPATVNDFDNHPSIVSYSLIKSSNWSFLSFIPYRYIQQRTAGVLSTSIGLVMLLLILATVFGLYLSGYYLTPLSKITQHFKDFQLGRSDLVHQLEEKGNNEISELTKWYNLFFLNLKEKEITDRKLAKSQSEYHQLVNSIREVLFRMNKASELIFLNSAWEDITSHTIKNAINTSILSFIHPDDKAKFEYAFNALLKGKIELKMEVRFLKPDQSDCWMEIIARIDEEVDKENKILISGIMIDVTERKELDVLKDNFINAVCHEIKTPFTSIKEGVQIFKDGLSHEINLEEQNYVFKTLNKNISRLQRLLDDLFIYKNIEEGEESFIIKTDSLNHLIENIVEEMRPQVEEKQLSLEFFQDKNLPPVDFDSDKLGKAFRYLFDNAIKYTKHGGIKISTQLSGDKALVKINDTGIGIQADDFSKLFQQFSQLSCGLNRTTGGTGLGLVIAKRIMDEHQGNIKVESEPNEGSCFTMELPIFINPL
jgi:two-component system phosphate regulon sensor histidine kinase PhoR